MRVCVRVYVYVCVVFPPPYNVYVYMYYTMPTHKNPLKKKKNTCKSRRAAGAAPIKSKLPQHLAAANQRAPASAHCVRNLCRMTS